MAEFYVSDTAQEIQQRLWALTTPSLATRRQTLETYRAITDALNQDIENIVADIENDTEPPESVFPPAPVSTSPLEDALAGTSTPTDVGEPVAVPTEPAAVNEPVTDADVAAVAAEVVPDQPVVVDTPDPVAADPSTDVSPTPVDDNGGDSVDLSDTGASPAPTVVDPQQQGDTEPGPVSEAPVTDTEPVAAPVVDNPVETVSVSDLVDAANADQPVPATPDAGTPADPGSLPDNT